MKNQKLEKLFELGKSKEEWRKMDAGTQGAVNSYFNSQEYDCLVIRDIWEQETDGLVDCLRACEVKEIVFADTSTEAMKALIKMIEKGCKVTGVKVYKTIDWITHIEEYKGLVIEL